MLLALEGKNKICFINGSCKRSNEDEILGKKWDRMNAIVLGWILNSISEKLFLDEQMATLISLIKDNKVGKNMQANMAGFESKKYSGIGEQCERLYYYNDKDHVLNVLKDSLNINKKDNTFIRRDNDFVATHNEEVATLEENVFSRGRKGIRSKWIYKIKFMSGGEIDKYKARLVAQGFRQKEGINYEETFSLVVKMVTVRCLMNIVVSMSWPVFQLDVNNAFLYGDLEEVAFIKPPEGYFPSDNKVCRHKRFSQSKTDYSLYTKSDKGVFLALLVYMDDIIIIDTDKGICVTQRKYVLDLLFEYGMVACKLEKTPLMSKLVISIEAGDKYPLLENITNYQKLMGKLIYLTNTRPDISYVVYCLSQFMHSPMTFHLKIAFKILRYLKSC
nr:ribonuclease H-like domain-containing protein [Tanacetum cinerariifolium]